jgi:hypothetical protein
MTSTRLLLEHESVCQTLVRTDHAWLSRTSLDLLRHDVVYAVRTVVRDAAGSVRVEEREVGVIFQLFPDHPRVPPLVICQQEDVFNSHVHDVRRGDPPLSLVCMGTFHAERRLGDWIEAVWDVLAWRRIAADHPLNPEAAEWARLEGATPGRFPVDPREFARPRRARARPESAPQESGGAAASGLRILSPWRPS